MAKLKVDFFESGDGETILIEFPDGGLGLVDAHPSCFGTRPDILTLVSGRHLHFVCLTHPHADHGIDLIPILRKHTSVAEFWHTNSDVSGFVYHCATERPNYPSPVRKFVNELADGWADFLLDLYSSVGKIPARRLHSKIQPANIAGVQIWFLGPDEQVTNQFVDAYKHRASGRAKALPSPNSLSAILALVYGDTLVLLGADALKRNWNDALKAHASHGLPRAAVLKVPHHGAANAIALEKSRKNYLDMCIKGALAVLFGGDAKHPNDRVFEKLISQTQLICLANARKGAHGAKNPLGLRLPRAQAVRRSYVCQPHISIEIDASGAVTTPVGACCSVCC